MGYQYRYRIEMDNIPSSFCKKYCKPYQAFAWMSALQENDVVGPAILGEERMILGLLLLLRLFLNLV